MVTGTMEFYNFSSIDGNVIIPTDALIFFRGVGLKPPTSYTLGIFHLWWWIMVVKGKSIGNCRLSVEFFFVNVKLSATMNHWIVFSRSKWDLGQFQMLEKDGIGLIIKFRRSKMQADGWWFSFTFTKLQLNVVSMLAKNRRNKTWVNNG